MKKIFILLSLIVLCSGIQAQNISVKGRIVSEEDNEGIPGVNVIIKGTTQGTVTGTDGYYQINVTSGQTLRFTSVGFIIEEIVVNSQSEINVTMKSDVKSLEEVVVVGYGEQRKASIVGAISNVKGEDLRRAAPSNLTSAIGGRVTGALVRLGDGNVGGGDNRYGAGVLDDAQIFIRGRATTNTATPLVLVDGVESSFSRINPEDVDQFSILKDAAATAIYGVRGANGVIVITTKQGSVGKPKVTLNGQVRFHQPLKFPRPLGAYERALLMNEARRNAGNTDLYSQEDLDCWLYGTDPYGHADFSWYDEVVKDFFLEEQYNMNVTGGTDKVRYYLSGEYNHAGGPFDAVKDLENNYKRYNLRTNFDFALTKTTDLSMKLNGRLESRGDISYGESTGQRYYGSFWYGILTQSGYQWPIYNPNGTYQVGDNNNWNLRALLNEGGYRTRMSNTLDTNITLRQTLDAILPGLSARAMYSSVYSSGSRRHLGGEGQTELWKYTPPVLDGAGNIVTSEKYEVARPKVALTRGSSDNTNLPFVRRSTMEFALNYEKLFVEKHRVTALALVSQSKSESNFDLPVAYRGLSGRITYDYKSKYLVESNMAYNGSDQFDKDSRYALFPSISAGWVISEENFWKERLQFINFLKIRGSYGLVGNDRIGSYRFLYRPEYPVTTNAQTWGDYDQEVYNFGEVPTRYTQGLREGKLGNDKVTWEIAKKTNLGVDIHLWQSKIRMTAEVFHEKRNNIMVVRGDLPTQSGLNSALLPPQNIREVSNKGYEFELLYSDTFGDFDFTIGGNYTFARSNVDYAAEAESIYPYQMIQNYPVGQSIGYVWTGKFYTQEDIDNPSVAKNGEGANKVIPGDLMMKDINGDGVITIADRTRDRELGYTDIPEIIYGFNAGFGFKGFYLDLFFQGAAHMSSRWINEIVNEFYGNKNVMPMHRDRWVYQPDNNLDTRATAKYPVLLPDGGSLWTKEVSSFSLKNSSFLRLKTAELGYNFPKAWINKIQLSALRVFLSGSNIWTFDKVGFVDPEYNPQGSGNRGNSYPQTKFYAVGVNVTF